MMIGSSGSIFTIARVLQTKRASQGSHAWHISHFTSGLSKIPTPFKIPVKENTVIFDLIAWQNI
jgi:hypothetical protein